MEIKKSRSADLERKRNRRFLFGLLTATLAFIAVLYMPLRSHSDSDNDIDIDDIIQELEALKKEEKHDEIPLMKRPEDKMSEKMVEVENYTDTPDDADIEIEPRDDEGEPKDEDVKPTEAISPIIMDEKEKVLSWRIVEQMPDFPGGMVEFMKWLTKSLKYPETAYQQKIQGEVEVSFVVNKDGTISDITLEKSVDKLLDDEALRVLKTMPKWKPGKDKDQPCRTMISIPIVFKI